MDSLFTSWSIGGIISDFKCTLHNMCFLKDNFCCVSPIQFSQGCNIKTSQELQNGALRTSHQLSNMSNCSF